MPKPSTSPRGYQHELQKYPSPPSSSDHDLPRARADGEVHRHPDDEDDLLDEDLGSLIEWRKALEWRKWVKWRYVPYYILLVICLVLVALMTLYHKQIIQWLKPPAKWMKDLPFGYLIPIAILFVISFPPLFGHEIIGVLAGVIWGLWVGFGIVAAGTFLGEMGNFYAFKYCCRARAEKIEKKDLSYACLAHVVREGGFWIALLARYSAIPGHFTTIVFACSGMSIWIFALSCICSLPKQLIVVYLGVVLENTDADKTSKIISDCVLAVSFLVTIFAAWYIWHRMNQARGPVVKERRRLAKIKRLGQDNYGQSASSYPSFPLNSSSNDSLVGSDPAPPPRRGTQDYQPGYEIRHGRDQAGDSWYQVPSPPLQEQDQRTPTAGNWRGGGGVQQQLAMSAEEREWQQHEEDQRRLQQYGQHPERQSSDPYANPSTFEPYQPESTPPSSAHAYQPSQPFHPSTTDHHPERNSSEPYAHAQIVDPYALVSSSSSPSSPYAYQPSSSQSISNSHSPVTYTSTTSTPHSKPQLATPGRPPYPSTTIAAPAYSFVGAPAPRSTASGIGGGVVSLTDGEGEDDWRRR